MDKSRRPTYLNANAVAAQIAAPGNFNDDPYAIDLERRDHLPGDSAADSHSSAASAFMMAVLGEKEALLKEAEFVRKLMRLDEITVGPDKEVVTKKKKIVKQKKAAVEDSPVQTKAKSKGRRRAIISSDEEEDEVDKGISGKKTLTATSGDDDEDVKEEKVAEEEVTDEEEELQEEDYEEDNDYMNAHFDNGEEYAD